MILFYNKKTGDIFGSIMGRIHPQEIIDNAFIQPSDIDKMNIGRYVVPYRPVKKVTRQPIKEMRVVDNSGLVKEIEIGYRNIEVTEGVEPDVPFKDLICAFENITEDAHQYRIVEENGQVKNIVKK